MAQHTQKPRPLSKRLTAAAIAAALILALGITAYAADWFGIQALLRSDASKIGDATYADLSLSQPQAVPDGLDPVIADSIENNEKAWAEWEAYQNAYDYGTGYPAVLEEYKDAFISIDEADDGSYEVSLLTEDGQRGDVVAVMTAEEYEDYISYVRARAATYGDYDDRYDIHDAQQEAKLEEIAAKYGLALRRQQHILWSSDGLDEIGSDPSSGEANFSEMFLSNEELAAKTAEIGCAGNLFAATPSGFDKLYWYDEGTFGVSYTMQLPDSGEDIMCYGYNSMYTTLSSGQELQNFLSEEELALFTERTHTAPDGTKLTILQGAQAAYVYVYLESSFFTLHISGSSDLTDADVDYLTDQLNYSLIG